MTDFDELFEVTEISEAIETRHSARLPFDPDRLLADGDLRTILEAARWALAHNMQNFEIIVLDDKATLAAIGRVRGGTSEEFNCSRRGLTIDAATPQG